MPTGYRPEIIQRPFIDFIGSRLYPFWSLTVPKLRLIARHAISDDLIALQFEPNHAFTQQVFGSRNHVHDGWQGGQHINLTVIAEGIHHQRSYSLIGLPQQPLWWHDDTNKKPNKNNRNKKLKRQTVTIAIKPQGLVSNYLTQQVPLGMLFNSSVPKGTFTLEQAALKKQANLTNERPSLLFIAGGSGITPMLGLITQALEYGYKVTLLHYNRTSLLKNLFRTHWQNLAAQYPTFNYYLINTNDPKTYLANSRHLNAPSLLSLKLSLVDTLIFACGSQALLAGLYHAAETIVLPDSSTSSHNDLLSGKSLRDNIIIENFGNALSELTSDNLNSNGMDNQIENKKPQTVYLRSRQRQFTSSSTLLLGAEEAGIRLPYGCRQGICQLCRCNKVSGVVKNIQTGKISTDGYESIQTCINVAITDLVLDI